MAGDNLQKCPIPGAGLAISLCGEDGVTFKNRTYTPDATKGFFTFSLCYPFPNVNEHGTGLHPNVISKSFKSLLYQGANRDHAVAAYFKDKQVDDKYVGAIIDVDYPEGGNMIVGGNGVAQGISGVAVVWKQSQGMAHLMGRHLSGQHKYTVSIECLWPLEESGFAVPIKQGFKREFASTTPRDFELAGYEYVPYDKAPKSLISTYSEKARRITGLYKGRKASVLMGGLDNQVHYAGVGIVRYGAEAPAKIMRLAAGIDDPAFSNLADSIDRAVGLVTLQNKLK